ncbi:MAG: hypothetical protein QW385_07545 [Thermoproteota archaeon]
MKENVLLFEDWKDFIALLPEERIVHAYRDVNALYHVNEIREAREGMITIRHGDLVLTDKRLAYLEYKYGSVPLSFKMRLMKMFAILIIIVIIIAGVASLTIVLLPLTLPIIFVSLFLLSVISKHSPKVPPIGYVGMGFEIPLEKIVETRQDSSLKDFLEMEIMHRKGPILVRFRNIQETNEFRRILSHLVYEAQHLPKEIIQYSIVTKFNLDENGTVSVQCPYCGASAPLQSKETEVTCKYCGKQYIIPKKILDLIR